MRRVTIGVFARWFCWCCLWCCAHLCGGLTSGLLLSRFGSLIEKGEHGDICYNWYLKFPDRQRDPDRHAAAPLHEPLAGADDGQNRVRSASGRSRRGGSSIRRKFYYTFGGSDERAQATMETILVGLVPKKISTHQLDDLFNADVTKIHSDDIEKEVARDATEATARR